MNRSLRKVFAVSGAVGLVLDTACFSYVKVAGTGVTPGSDVRLELSADGTAALAQYLGPRVTGVDGTLSAVQGDSAIVVVPYTVQAPDGGRQYWTGEGSVAIPLRYLTSVSQKVLDRRRSTWGGVALAGTLVGIAILALKSGGAHGNPDAGGTPPPP